MNRATGLFLKALGAIYLIAFVSFGVQADGLIGSQGILPVANYLRAMRHALGPRAFWYAPTAFWIDSSDLALRVAWIAGAVLAIVLMLSFFRRVCLIALLILYISISTAGQDFWSFQWDILLTEAGFLAIFADGSPGRTWLFRWLLFRLVFMSGAVKLMSGDPTWRGLTALSYHYFTQPLPTPIAWYMHQLPAWFQKASTVFVFFVELLVPFLIFAPRKLRRIAACVLIGLQVLILLTGNYTFFNLLAIALCVFLFVERPARDAHPETRTHLVVTLALMIFVLITSGLQFLEMFHVPLPQPAQSYLAWISPLRLINSYGLFAVMTTTRPEIVVEGSNDGTAWTPYEFRYKPGDVKRAPPWVAPYQPRLDWQMWFAALGSADENRWFYNFAARLLQGSAPVVRLLERNPFPGNPPRYIRAVVYDYRFTNFAERRSSGAWWLRDEKAIYLPSVGQRHALPFGLPVLDGSAWRALLSPRLDLSAQSLVPVLHTFFERGPHGCIAPLPFHNRSVTKIRQIGYADLARIETIQSQIPELTKERCPAAILGRGALRPRYAIQNLFLPIGAGVHEVLPVEPRQAAEYLSR